MPRCWTSTPVLPGIDEPATLEQLVRDLQAVTDLPLQLDSSNPDALSHALRIYNGKPIVNSVNGEQSTLDMILPLCKKYGAAVVGLALDEHGIPATADGRFAIAQRIVKAANAVGIPNEDIYIDCLTLTASAQQEGAVQTLEALTRCKKELGVRTVLGVSNISFGLPCRGYLNTTFLTMAMVAGLDLAIMNPQHPRDDGRRPRLPRADLPGPAEHPTTWLPTRMCRFKRARSVSLRPPLPMHKSIPQAGTPCLRLCAAA